MRPTDDGATWGYTPVHTALSDPNHARWFSGATNGKSLFIGDYTGLALDGTGRAHLNWTDLRLNVVTGLQIPPNRRTDCAMKTSSTRPSDPKHDSTGRAARNWGRS